VGSEGAVACFMWLLVQIEANRWSLGVLAVNEFHEFLRGGLAIAMALGFFSHTDLCCFELSMALTWSENPWIH
jgi:hypothetical protein